MLKRIVMQMTGLGTALCIRLWALLTVRLWNPVNSLLASYTLKFQSVVNLNLLRAKILLSTKVLLALCITLVQSIRLALKLAVTTSGQIGLRLATTARQILQRVNLLRKKGK